MTALRSAAAVMMVLSGLAAPATYPSVAKAAPIVFDYTGSLVTFAVPTTDTYQILAFGAQGGSGPGTDTGGLGAEIGGTFRLTVGEALTIAVGGAGASNTGPNSHSGGAGGGGSFVVGPGNTPLVIAGGGGGAGYSALFGNVTGQGGLTGTAGGAVGTIFGGAGGADGNGGGFGVRPSLFGGPATIVNGGGGGFFTAGTDDSFGGAAFSDLTGGSPGGGFGGGGGGLGGGGGGGYSGGGGGGAGGPDFPFGPGGGGGSFDAGIDQILVADFQTGNGEVIITELAAAVPEPASVALLGAGLLRLHRSQAASVAGLSTEVERAGSFELLVPL
jgi:hypothetical protein